MTKIWPGNKNEFQREKLLINNEVKSQIAMYRTSGFVQTRHETIEARVNHQETDVK